MDNEYESLVMRLKIHLEDNTQMIIDLNRALLNELRWDTKHNPEIVDVCLMNDEFLVKTYGSKKTKLLYEALQEIDSMRRPISEAIDKLRRADRIGE